MRSRTRVCLACLTLSDCRGSCAAADAYNALKYTDHGKRDDMREQEMMKLQMQQAYRVGDHTTAAQLKRKLKPDEPKFDASGKVIR